MFRPRPRLILLLATLLASGARAEESQPPVESHWGVFPAETDSVTAVFHHPSPPAWQTVVDVPYHVASVPLRLVVGGIGATVRYLDERHVVYRIARLIGPRELPYGVVGSFSAGGLTGLGVGATAVHDAFFGPDNRFRVGGKTSQNGHHRALLGIELGIGHPRTTQLGFGYRKSPNARFFGIGPTTREADESYYSREMTWMGASLHQTLGANVGVEASVLYSQVHAFGPRDDDDPALKDVYDATPFGYGHRSDGVSLGIALEHDDTAELGRPETGGYRRLAAHYYTETSRADIAFVTYRAEVQHFFPLWFSKRALALRAFYSWIDPVTGDVPFQRLMTNDDPDLLRGYRDFRWHDRGMAVFTAEYRWPVWASSTVTGTGLDAYLFTDLGQVFGDPDELAARNVTESFGGGLRLVGSKGFTGRIEVGWSDEETIFRIRSDQVFQFQKHGLYHGRNPIPAR